jgi:large subunit ribosomal protein L15
MDLRTVCAKGTKYKARHRVGRGPGSGSGKTSGRGHKGRGARSGASRRPGYEGGQMPIYRRIPKRGFTNARFRKVYTTINVEALNVFADGDVVDLEAILGRGLVSRTSDLLKILGDGKLERKLTVRAQKCTGSAVEKILAAGGEIVTINARGKEVTEADEADAKPNKKAKAKARAKAKAESKSEESSDAPKGEDEA